MKRDEKINKKETLLLTHRPGKHENSVDEAEGKWALGTGGPGNGGQLFGRAT